MRDRLLGRVHRRQPHAKRKAAILRWCIGLTVATGALVSAIAYRIARGRSSIARKRFLTRIVGALAPLKPSLDELDAAIAALKTQQNAVAQSLSARNIWDALNSAAP